MPTASKPTHVMLTPGAEYLDSSGRLWRVDGDGIAKPTNSVAYKPKKTPMSAFGAPGSELPPPPPPDLLQQATNWVNAYVPGGWWLITAVGGVLAWQLLRPPEPPERKRSEPEAPRQAPRGR